MNDLVSCLQETADIKADTLEIIDLLQNTNDSLIDIGLKDNPPIMKVKVNKTAQVFKVERKKRKHFTPTSTSALTPTSTSALSTTLTSPLSTTHTIHSLSTSRKRVIPLKSCVLSFDQDE